jgi:hypothetical protein
MNQEIIKKLEEEVSAAGSLDDLAKIRTKYFRRGGLIR